jgi:HSP20 family molecular chaperone IbpA
MDVNVKDEVTFSSTSGEYDPNRIYVGDVYNKPWSTGDVPNSPLKRSSCPDFYTDPYIDTMKQWTTGTSVVTDLPEHEDTDLRRSYNTKRDAAGNLYFDVDVCGYERDQISVKTEGNDIVITLKKREEDEDALVGDELEIIETEFECDDDELRISVSPDLYNMKRVSAVHRHTGVLAIRVDALAKPMSSVSVASDGVDDESEIA